MYCASNLDTSGSASCPYTFSGTAPRDAGLKAKYSAENLSDLSLVKRYFESRVSNQYLHSIFLRAPAPAATYAGTFSGEDSGVFEVSIANGRITGTADSIALGRVAVAGNLDTMGGVSFATLGGGASSGAQFIGFLDSRTGVVSGTWSNKDVFGTFHGTRR